MSKHSLVICADDFAQNAMISDGILNLAMESRVNAISCLVNGSHWHKGCLGLKRGTAAIQIGLHLNLTSEQALSPSWIRHYGKNLPTLSQLLRLIALGQLHVDVVVDELTCQWETFCDELGSAPDFVDGHQHIHQLGVIRQACLQLLHTQAFSGWCRVSTNGWSDLYARQGFPKPAAMCLLGGRRLREQLSQATIPMNTHFEGFYPFKRAQHYRHYFRQFLDRSPSGGLIMCHPGLLSQDRQDPLYASRGHEYAYLMSEAYWQDREEFGFEKASH